MPFFKSRAILHPILIDSRLEFPGDVLVGYGSDAGYVVTERINGLAIPSGGDGPFMFQIPSYADDGGIDMLIPKLVVDGRSSTPTNKIVNGRMAWSNVWYSAVRSHWIYSSRVGVEPDETYDYVDGKLSVRGTGFYVFETGVSSILAGSSGTAVKHSDGAKPPGDTVEVTTDWSMVRVWSRKSAPGSSDRLCGEYTPVNNTGAHGDRFVGTPVWKSPDGQIFAKSIDTDKYGAYTYGPIHYESGRWVIGSQYSQTGYWSGSQPVPGESVTFTFVPGKDPPKPTPPSISLSFDGYKFGVFYDKVLMGQFATWM